MLVTMNRILAPHSQLYCYFYYYYSLLSPYCTIFGVTAFTINKKVPVCTSMRGYLINIWFN